MLSVISPAKKLNMDPVIGRDRTTPRFLDEARMLVDVAREQDVAGLRKLMGISEKLAQLNVDRFVAYSDAPATNAVKQSMYIFDGDTYTGLDAKTLDDDAVTYAQDHLRILSGLYGVLRPLDEIQAYRLEMGSKLATERGKNLYEFWGGRVAEAMNADVERVDANYVLNCASNEYFSVVDRDVLRAPIITPTFLEERDGGVAKVISFYAKKARGAMARFVVENRITDPKALAAFDVGGYVFDPNQSSDENPVFSRRI